MNTNQDKPEYCNENQTLTGRAVASCQRLVTVIESMKDRMIQEFGAKLAGHETVLRLALNEAEALAWQTQYPHLVFATLAREKAHAAVKWENRQQFFHHHSPVFSPVVRASNY